MVYIKIKCESCGGSYENKHIKRHFETNKHKFSLLSSDEQQKITDETIRLQKEKDKAKAKEKYIKNKEKIIAWQAENKDKMKENRKKYYEANKEHSIETSKKYYAANRERIWARIYKLDLPKIV